MFVKICGITNEADALLAVGLGADALGFVFAPSPRQVPWPRVKEITSRLPHGVLTVGIFRDEHPQRVVETVRQAGLMGVQLHGHESPKTVAEIMSQVKWVIKSVVAGSVEAQHADDFPTDLVLLDSATPGTGTLFDWNLAGEVPDTVRVLISGGLTPENVATAILQVDPFGVDVSSGVERQPGYKDPAKLMRFMKNARDARKDNDQSKWVNQENLYDWQDE